MWLGLGSSYRFGSALETHPEQQQQNISGVTFQSIKVSWAPPQPQDLGMRRQNGCSPHLCVFFITLYNPGHTLDPELTVTLNMVQPLGKHWERKGRFVDTLPNSMTQIAGGP